MCSDKTQLLAISLLYGFSPIHTIFAHALLDFLFVFFSHQPSSLTNHLFLFLSIHLSIDFLSTYVYFTSIPNRLKWGQTKNGSYTQALARFHRPFTRLMRTAHEKVTFSLFNLFIFLRTVFYNLSFPLRQMRAPIGFSCVFSMALVSCNVEAHLHATSS